MMTSPATSPTHPPQPPNTNTTTETKPKTENDKHQTARQNDDDIPLTTHEDARAETNTKHQNHNNTNTQKQHNPDDAANQRVGPITNNTQHATFVAKLSHNVREQLTRGSFMSADVVNDIISVEISKRHLNNARSGSGAAVEFISSYSVEAALAQIRHRGSLDAHRHCRDLAERSASLLSPARAGSVVLAAVYHNNHFVLLAAFRPSSTSDVVVRSFDSLGDGKFCCDERDEKFRAICRHIFKLPAERCNSLPPPPECVGPKQASKSNDCGLYTVHHSIAVLRQLFPAAFGRQPCNYDFVDASETPPPLRCGLLRWLVEHNYGLAGNEAADDARHDAANPALQQAIQESLTEHAAHPPHTETKDDNRTHQDTNAAQHTTRYPNTRAHVERIREEQRIAEAKRSQSERRFNYPSQTQQPHKSFANKPTTAESQARRTRMFERVAKADSSAGRWQAPQQQQPPAHEPQKPPSLNADSAQQQYPANIKQHASTAQTHQSTRTRVSSAPPSSANTHTHERIMEIHRHAAVALQTSVSSFSLLHHPQLERLRQDAAQGASRQLKRDADRSMAVYAAKKQVLVQSRYVEITWARASTDSDALPWRRDVAYVKSRSRNGIITLQIAARQQYHDEWVVRQVRGNAAATIASGADAAPACAPASTAFSGTTVIELTLPCKNQDVLILNIKAMDPPVEELPPSMNIAVNVDMQKARYVIRTGCSVFRAAGSLNGPSAAALYVTDLRHATVDQHAIYCPRSSASTLQWVALAAGMRLASKLAPHQAIVVTQERTLYKMVTGATDGPRDAFTHERCVEVQRLLAQPHIAIAEVDATTCNAAGALATHHVTRQSDVGDASLFERPPVEANAASLPARATIRAPDVGEELMRAAAFITNTDDFASLRRFHTRSFVPRGAAGLWAQHVKCLTSRIVGRNISLEDRSRALIALHCLPHLLLPTNASTTRILHHLSDGRAFKIDQRDRNVTSKNRPLQRNPDHRDPKSKRVEALMNDCRVRSAVKLMQADAAARPRRPEAGVGADGATTQEAQPCPATQTFDDAQWRQDVETLRSKFPQREPENAFDVEPVRVVPQFPEFDVLTCINKLSRNAATAIDGWTRDLLKSATDIDPSIAADLGLITSWIAMSHAPESQTECLYFNDLAMDVVRAARLVGIPKPEGGVRPIVISSFFAKLTGALILRQARVRKLRNQFAIDYRNGGPRIIHRAREAFRAGKAVIRLDSSNAFNRTPRKNILNVLKNKLEARDGCVSSEMLQYFITMYHPTSRMYVFGRHGTFQIVLAEEGVRQGDALAAFYFCLVMELFTDDLRAEFDDDAMAELSVECYMDDSTIICAAASAERVADRAIELMHRHGFKVNVDKSSAICKAGFAEQQLRVPVTPAEQEFKMLGGIINDIYGKLFETLNERIDKFFDSLDALIVHPEIKHTIMYFCGMPKLIYFASTTPPEFSAPVLRHFDARVKLSFARLIDVNDAASVRDDLLHAVEGACIPDYVSNARALYANSVTSTTTSAAAHVGPPPRVMLTVTTGATSHVEAEYDSCWQRYIHPTAHRQLPPLLYTTALAMRVLKIPQHVCRPDKPVRCECTELCTTNEEIIAHALRCDAMSKITAGARHTILKSAIANIARAYGISCANEPGFYIYDDVVKAHTTDSADTATGADTAPPTSSDPTRSKPQQQLLMKKRPDATFYTDTTLMLPVVTDYTIVAPHASKPGAAASAAAAEKVKIHDAAAKRAGHEFIPFAVETTGHLDKSCYTLFNRLASSVVPSARYAVRRDLIGATSTALAEFRARAIVNACFAQLSVARYA